MSFVFAPTLLLPVLHVAHLTGLRNTLAAVIAIWTLAILIRQRALPPLAVPVLGWLVLALTSALWSADAQATLKSVVTDIVMPMGVFYAAHAVAGQERALKHLAIALTGSMAILALVALATAVGLSPLAHYYPGPGVASTLAVYALPAGLALAWHDDRYLRRLGYGVIGLVIVVGLLTLNRTFWLAVIAALAAFGAWHWSALSGKKRGALAVGIAFAVAATVVAIASINGMRSPDDGRRIQALREWSAISSDAPWIGHGFGKDVVHQASQGRLSAQLSRIDPNLRSHAHNLFVDIVVQVGLVGLAMFCLLLWVLAVHAYRARDPARLAAGGALIALIAAMAIKNMTDDFMGHAVVVAFWLHAGLLLGRLRPVPA
jgi:O-antigen ligase